MPSPDRPRGRARKIATFKDVSEEYFLERGTHKVEIYHDLVSPVTYFVRYFHDTVEVEAFSTVAYATSVMTNMAVEHAMFDIIEYGIEQAYRQIEQQTLKGYVV